MAALLILENCLHCVLGRLSDVVAVCTQERGLYMNVSKQWQSLSSYTLPVRSGSEYPQTVLQYHSTLKASWEFFPPLLSRLLWALTLLPSMGVVLLWETRSTTHWGFDVGLQAGLPGLFIKFHLQNFSLLQKIQRWDNLMIWFLGDSVIWGDWIWNVASNFLPPSLWSLGLFLISHTDILWFYFFFLFGRLIKPVFIIFFLPFPIPCERWGKDRSL